MSIWVVRGGKFGEYENRFLNEDKVYLTRDGFKTDLNKISEQAGLEQFLMIFILLNPHPNYQAGPTKYGILLILCSRKIG